MRAPCNTVSGQSYNQTTLKSIVHYQKHFYSFVSDSEMSQFSLIKQNCSRKLTTDSFALLSKRQSLPPHGCVPVPVLGPSKCIVSRNYITIHTLTLTDSKLEGMHCSVTDVNKQNKAKEPPLHLNHNAGTPLDIAVMQKENRLVPFFFMLGIPVTNKITQKLSQDLFYLPAKSNGR